MTFKSIDEYEQCMEQINESQYEEMIMLAEQEEEFNNLMKEMDEEIAARTGIRQKETGVKSYKNRPDYGPEMERLSHLPHGTSVWTRDFLGKWYKTGAPSWTLGKVYVVDDEHAEERKTKIDRKLQNDSR